MPPLPLYTTVALPKPEAASGSPARDPVRFGSMVVTELSEGSFPPRPAHHCWVYVTLNAEIALELPRNSGLQHLMGSDRLRTSIDGQWLLWALRRKYTQHSLDKLSGSDLIHRLAAQCAQQGHRLLLLGSTPARNARTVERLQASHPGLFVRGAALPRYQAGTESELEALRQAVAQCNAHHVQYVVLGLGAEKEHRLAAMLSQQLDGQAIGIFCFGGAIDLASGDVPRAPRWLQQCGLEGPWRVWVQPQRAWRFVKVLRILPALALGRY